MKRLKNIIGLFLLCLFLITVSGCRKTSYDDINILFTTDVHCGIDDNLGYSSLKAYKNYLKENNKYVSLVDSGDAIQGNIVGSISKGKYIIDIMNEVGYDMMTLGNHEFDYGMDSLNEAIDLFNGDVLSCNIKYIGQGENKLKDVKPYKIMEYGKTKVGFVGVTTPTTAIESNPENFKENGVKAYSFTNDTLEEYYSCVQENIDLCYKNNCKYVILLSHVGYGDSYENYGSIDLVSNLSNVTAVLDGHSHKNIECSYYKDKNDSYVPICNAGTKLNEIGKLVIGINGNITISFIKKFDGKDSKVEELITNINDEVSSIGDRVVATSDIDLKITDSNGIRMVRNRETAIGNLISDAYRLTTGANIGVVNGGGIRANINLGDITYSDLKQVHPFGNKLVVVEASGEEIRDYLEFCSRLTQANYKDSNGAIGEFGGFASVSGLRYEINTSVPSSVEVNLNDEFVAVTGERRVTNIEVLENGVYSPLELDKTYSVASHDFLLLSGGDGCNMFINNEIISRSDLSDYEVLISYIMDYLHGNLGDKYMSAEGRIHII